MGFIGLAKHDDDRRDGFCGESEADRLEKGHMSGTPRCDSWTTLARSR